MRRLGLLIIACLLTRSASAAEIDFDTEIVPLLSKAGCNAASCHGGAAGQAGFRLSLFGGDPEFDHRTIAHELESRRLDFENPGESLLLAKPTGQLDHGGGEVLDLEGDAAKTISSWIAAGGRRLQKRQLDRLLVSPREFDARELPAVTQVQVIAVFNDGLQRDVTETAVYVSQNDAAVRAAPGGTLTVTRPGQHSVIVRFAGQVETISVMSPIGQQHLGLPEYARQNWIDDEINTVLAKLQLRAAASSDDYRFLRRLSLDLTGRLPSTEVVSSFAADPDPAKRRRRVASLLKSSEYSDYWTHRLGTWLRLRNPGVDAEAGAAFHGWIRQCVESEIGWDVMARELVLSEGDTHQHGAATVHRFFATAREQAEYMSEVLMGVRLRCANCHNHPLDRWTQDDYHGLAAIFAQLQRGRVVRVSDRGDNIHPRTGLPAPAKIPGDALLEAGLDGRGEFAEWLTDAGNPYFARAIVGRVWAALMGRGLVTPVDDLRATNPPTHPRLMARLADFLVEQDYQLRPLVELICNSAAYARRSEPPTDQGSDDRFYSHALVKPLSAEVLADAISDVTGVYDDYSGSDRDAAAAMMINRDDATEQKAQSADVDSVVIDRAVNAVDRSMTFQRLEVLGQCVPGEGCTGSAEMERGIATKLHLMNGELLNNKIVSPQGRLAKLFANDATVDHILTELFLMALARPPSDRELADWCRRIEAAGATDLRSACEDFLWAILNCHEFTTNH